MDIKEINRSTSYNEALSDFRAMYMNDELLKLPTLISVMNLEKSIL